jgi:hypothetical protein
MLSKSFIFLRNIRMKVLLAIAAAAAEYCPAVQAVQPLHEERRGNGGYPGHVQQRPAASADAVHAAPEGVLHEIAQTTEEKHEQ